MVQIHESMEAAKKKEDPQAQKDAQVNEVDPAADQA